MSYENVPKVVRIKRKRYVDPLQALFFEDRPKSKRSRVSPKGQDGREKRPLGDKGWLGPLYFTLATTEQSECNIDAGTVEWTLPDASENLEGENVPDQELRSFYLPKPASAEDTKVANELTEMVDSYLQVSKDDNKSRKSRAKRGKPSDVDQDDSERQSLSDYVYDIYHLQDLEPLTSDNYPKSSIGYIKFLGDDDEVSGLVDDRSGDEENAYSDDEDSNAEDFYQNDYPSDEDAGVYSETYTEDEDDVLDIVGSLDGKESSTDQGLNTDNYDQLFEELYENDNTDEYNLLNEDNHGREEQSEFERNTFFPSDEHDDLAIYRDKIFHKLKKMVDE